jgi:hypothetical protein
VFDTDVHTQQADAASQQMQAQYAEQQAATEAAAGDNWEYTGNDSYQMYTQWTTIEPTLGWPGNAAAAMATFVSATYASISDAQCADRWSRP